MHITIFMLTVLLFSQLPSALAKSSNTDFRYTITHLSQQYQKRCATPDWQQWGSSLCSPFIFVDPQSREAFATHSSLDDSLSLEGELYKGYLPSDQIIANTASHWAGVHWSMLLLPLPESQVESLELMTHEAWHRNNRDLLTHSNNAHLTELKGRYLLLLELRALSAALKFRFFDNNLTSSSTALSDAMHFREERYETYSSAQLNEQQLEISEGLAEYIALSLNYSSSTINRLINKLANAETATLERSFAYLTGPAYGLLLEHSDPLFKLKAQQQVQSKEFSFYAMTKDYLMTIQPSKDRSHLHQPSIYYDGESLWQIESSKQKNVEEKRQQYLTQFFKDKTLTIPVLTEMTMSFDPNKVFTLKPYGTVYTEITISDEWGKITTKNNLLLFEDFSKFIVSLSPDLNIQADSRYSEIYGKDWKLELQPDWRVINSGEGYTIERQQQH